MRLAALRRALAAAASAASADECLPPLAGLVDLAGAMSRAGGDLAARAGPVLDEVLSYLRALRPLLTAASPDHLVALYLEAEACLFRDRAAVPVSDLDNAIECLRRLRAALTGDDPDRGEVEFMLSVALCTRACRPPTAAADLGEARELLANALLEMAPDDPRRARARTALAVQCAFGFAAFGGNEADRAAAIGYARECVTTPGEAADLGHVMLAWMAIARQFSTEQRSVIGRSAQITAALSDGQAAASLRAELGDLSISRDDATIARTHLRQVSAAPASEAVRDTLPGLWVSTLSVLLRADGMADDVDYAAVDEAADDFRRLGDALENALAAVEQGSPEHDELLNMRALRTALLAQGTGGQRLLVESTDAMNEAVLRMPAGHPGRSAGAEILKGGLQRHVDRAGATPDAVSEAEIGQITAALSRISQADPELARAQLALGMRLFGLGAEHRSVTLDDRIGPQLERAVAGLAPDDPARATGEFSYWTSVAVQGTLRQQPDVVDSAVAQMKRVADGLPAGHPAQTYALSGMVYALVDRHSMGGEMRHLREAERYLTRAFDSVDPSGPWAEGGALYGALLYLRAHIELVWCNYSFDPSRLTRAIPDLERAAEMAGDTPMLGVSISGELDVARALRETTSAAPKGPAHLGPEARRAFAKLRETADRLGPDHPEYPTAVCQAANGLMLEGLADNDPSRIDQAIAMIAGACRIPRLAVRERPRLLALHGFALQTRYARGMPRNPRDLSNAIDRLEEARRAIDQEVGSPYAAETLQMLSGVYRLRGDAARGDVDRAVSYGLDGLREHVGDVLLQDSDDSALHVARRGTSDAVEMARWFLRRGRDAAAISALELGRGMVLHAATSGAGLTQALRAGGHAGLAAEWAGATAGDGQLGGDAESDLRYRTMLAIEKSPVEARLLSAPSVGEIAASLAEAAVDALVYLLPRDDSGPGLAVIVDQGKGVRGLPLHRLALSDDGPVRRFLRARQAVGQPGAGGDAPDWPDRLGELCDWAWQAAIGPLLTAIPDGGGSGHRRIVLVPCGELGLVPWHAARPPAPGEGGYACQRAVFSYAASARQFIDATRCRPRPWPEAPVLICDSSPSLLLSAAGIRHLFAEHYPAASVFGFARPAPEELARGVPGAPAARPADVLAALPGPGRKGASMLHFGCHGHSRVPVLHSYLRLGAGVTLEVLQILRQARAWQSSQRAEEAGSCGLVVLAACLSDVTDADYDEALTLATAFMSAGAGGVVAARWPVAENATALFMAMFHRYLNDGGLSPPMALQAAQLWMLDSGREVPDDLPAVLRDEAELAGEPDGPDLANPAAWAGFSYQGR